MACWQRRGRQAVILHSDRGTQFTSYEYQQFLKDHHITLSRSEVGHAGTTTRGEGFFGMLKRERVNRRRYLTVDDGRVDVFDYIERFHNPRIQRSVQFAIQMLVDSQQNAFTRSAIQGLNFFQEPCRGRRIPITNVAWRTRRSLRTNPGSTA